MPIPNPSHPILKKAIPSAALILPCRFVFCFFPTIKPQLSAAAHQDVHKTTKGGKKCKHKAIPPGFQPFGPPFCPPCTPPLFAAFGNFQHLTK